MGDAKQLIKSTYNIRTLEITGVFLSGSTTNSKTAKPRRLNEKEHASLLLSAINDVTGCKVPKKRWYVPRIVLSMLVIVIVVWHYICCYYVRRVYPIRWPCARTFVIHPKFRGVKRKIRRQYMFFRAVWRQKRPSYEIENQWEFYRRSS